VIELLEQPTLTEVRQITADIDDAEGRVFNRDGLVLEELGHVENDATGYDTYDDLSTLQIN